MQPEFILPQGHHDDVLLGEFREMIEMWSAVAVDLDARAATVFGLEEGRTVSEVIPVLAYAHVAKAAFSMSSAADISEVPFDPALFGKTCEAIARGQLTRYQRGKAADF